ncbi:MAG: DUF6134 family protein [Pseudomonadota bacterium]
MISPMLPVLSRRRFVADASLLGLAMTIPTSRAWSAVEWPGTDKPLMFNAYRNGSPLGFHRIDFSGSSDRLQVDIEISFDVKLAFIPLYRYRHRNREIWEDGKLVSLSSETDDNGEAFAVEAGRDGDRLIVGSSSGRQELPVDTPTTSYWNEAQIPRGEWIDTQSGKLVRSEVMAREPEPVEVAGERVDARRYDLVGDITCSLWYAEGRWVKLLFAGEDGSEIAYAIEASPQTTPEQSG